MRTRYSIINMMVNIGGQFLTMLLSFINRMVFIHCLSAAYLGVNGLFTDVLGILNLAELGVGTAMIYSLYEPAAKNDEHRLAQLMNLYRLLYRIVAVVVLLVGLALMPFLGFFIKDSSGIEHLRLIYLMYVANSVCSYLLSYKNSIYLAYQKAYVRNLWAQLCDAVKTLFQIVLIVAVRTNQHPKEKHQRKEDRKQTADKSDMFQFHFFFCPFFVTRLRVFSMVCWFFWTLWVC